MAKPTGRKKSQLPDCYYEGYLKKMSFRDQTCQKLWTCLCGNTLFFFSEKRDIDYVDKVDLAVLTSIEDDDDPDCEAYSTRFTIHLRSGSLKFIAPSTESRELWKGFILAVGQLSVPTSLNLLPGQIHMMGDAVEKEKERRANICPPADTDCTPPSTDCTPPSTDCTPPSTDCTPPSTDCTPPSTDCTPPSTDCTPNTAQSGMPLCYFEVPRLEAELLLEREASKGNLLVRPGRSLNSYSITTRIKSNGCEFKHYRVFAEEKGFCLNVQETVFAEKLQDIVDYLLNISDGTLKPLIIEEHYDNKISFIISDKESGERTLQHFPAAPAVLLRKHGDEKLTTPEAEPGGEQKSSLADKKCDEEKGSRGSSAVASSSVAPPRKILMPPSPFPRKSSITSPANNQGESRKLSNGEEQRRLLLPAMCACSESDEEKGSRGSSAVASTSVAPPRKILMPPSPFPRKSSITSPANNQGESRKLTDAEEQRRLLLPAISELKLKLGQRLNIQD